MTKEEKKKWIKANWKLMNGKKISEVLKRYWTSKENINGAAKKI